MAILVTIQLKNNKSVMSLKAEIVTQKRWFRLLPLLTVCIVDVFTFMSHNTSNERYLFLIPLITLGCVFVMYRIMLNALFQNTQRKISLKYYMYSIFGICGMLLLGALIFYIFTNQ